MVMPTRAASARLTIGFRPAARASLRACLASVLTGLMAAVLCAACTRTPETSSRSPVDLRRAALSVPAGFVGATLASGLEDPTAMAFAPDGRLFVCEQGGALRVVSGGQLRATPFLRVPVDASGERGLLGVAFDPAFSSNRQVYIYYTARTPTVHNRLSRFRASLADPHVAESGSETVLLELDTLSSATNHNGGAIHFGPDGKLYVAVGDNARGSNAQTLGNLLGKLLRLEPDGRIPADNPFASQASGKNRAIWALGLRNPFTFAFDMTGGGSGRLYINDVGQGEYEEIDAGVAGANYGWPATEGVTSDPRYRTPVHAYDHDSGCAIAGGVFYKPGQSSFPAELHGDYFFADYCGGWVRVLDVASGTTKSFASGVADPVDLDLGSDGALYILSRGSGRVERISASSSGQPPIITMGPVSVEAAAGQSVTFSVQASGTAPLTYQWQRDGGAIPGATSPSLQVSDLQVEDDGARFRVVVSNGFGQAISAEALLRVTSQEPPVGTIIAPSAGDSYQGGQTIHYAAEGSDPEDGELPDEAFSFWVDLHHADHTHPAQPATVGRTGSFVVPVEGEVSPDVFYRVHLLVRDSSGLVHESFVDVHPVLATITLATDPPGLALELDGASVSSPHSFQGVAGIWRQVGAPSPQDRDGQRWVFAGWSDGGPATHTIATPDVDSTLVARFHLVVPPAFKEIWEAEEALLQGAVVTTAHAGFTGAGFVDYLRPSGDFVEWTVSVPTGGRYDLELRYANSSSSLRPLSMRVNGVLLGSAAQFPRTSSWNDWRTIRVPATLTSGQNRIRATAISASGPNLDHLKLIPR